MTSITHSALAEMYGISRKTLYNWLKRAEINVRKGCAICWKDQQKIFDMFGDPEVYKQLQREKAEKKEVEMSTAVIMDNAWITYHEFMLIMKAKNFQAKNIEIINDLPSVRSIINNINIKRVIKVITK